MATFNGFDIPNPDAPMGGRARPTRSGELKDGGSITTYYYRNSNGTRSSTTSLSSVPSGAVIERVASG